MVHSAVFEDNNGALSLEISPKLTPLTKKLGVQYHWFRDQIGEEKGFVLSKIKSVNQKADIFTKGLVEAFFVRIRKLLQGW